ncbi:exonuclease domain-containing protein [Succinimonas amylolytica]|uniref:exonuclease domain-containing protein n=1 Tax=Succinimonas amylolytica TaxID=83769 RepID=UPI00320927F7
MDSSSTQNNTETPENSESSMTLAERFRGFYPVIVDVETAGFRPETDALIEVAACTVKFTESGDLVRDESYHANILPFPGANLEKSNLDFLGVDPYAPERKAVTEESFLKPLFKTLSKKARTAGCTRCILVGQNGSFDHGFIMAAAERLNAKKCPFHPFSVIDLATLSMVFTGQSVLRVAVETAGLEFDGKRAHGAEYDAEIETDLFCRLINRYRDLGGWPLPPDMQERARVANEMKKMSFLHKKEETPQKNPEPDSNFENSPFAILKTLVHSENS